MQADSLFWILVLADPLVPLAGCLCYARLSWLLPETHFLFDEETEKLHVIDNDPCVWITGTDHLFQ